VVVPATVFQYLPALTPAAQVTSNVTVQPQAQPVAQVAVQQQGAQVAVAQQQQGAQVAVAQQQPVATSQAAAPVPLVQQQHVQTTEQIDQLLRARLDAILREKQYGIAADAPPPLEDPDQQQQPPPQPLQQAQPVQPQQAGQQTQADELQTRALAVVNQSCVMCHSPQSSKGDVTLVNAQGMWAPTKEGAPMSNSDVAAPVASGKMPRISPTFRNQPLTSQQRNDLIAWLRRG
jgi:hypothetical protein